MPSEPRKPSDSPPANDNGGQAESGAVGFGLDKHDDLCDVCGSAKLSWRKCKLICENCRAIVKSCADL